MYKSSCLGWATSVNIIPTRVVRKVSRMGMRRLFVLDFLHHSVGASWHELTTNARSRWWRAWFWQDTTSNNFDTTQFWINVEFRKSFSPGGSRKRNQIKTECCSWRIFSFIFHNGFLGFGIQAWPYADRSASHLGLPKRATIPGRIAQYGAKTHPSSIIGRLFESFKGILKDFKGRFVTMDETWFHHYTSEIGFRNCGMEILNGFRRKRGSLCWECDGVSFLDTKDIPLNERGGDQRCEQLMRGPRRMSFGRELGSCRGVEPRALSLEELC